MDAMKAALVRRVNDRMLYDVNSPSGFWAAITRNVAANELRDLRKSGVFPANRG